MIRTWELSIGNGAYFVVMTPLVVSIGKERGRDGGGASVSHEQFLRGEHQDFVGSIFGPEVLAEVIAAVRVSCEQASPEVPPPPERTPALSPARRARRDREGERSERARVEGARTDSTPDVPDPDTSRSRNRRRGKR